ncbi:hypothetical protein GV819_05735 [Pseudomonas sp. Fl5BN2]|uniref:hypothetical protein n=1 Tax=Pseudomonas sp. Fl5BN2 TaxID=2697652 RepID=UPI0013774C44|nr:hypothetical protein [Pseudomonas sp. Fl5BN2]NBF01787.1 hypothetical protein [Pseudomonas sp. Fl5BN2]
MSSMVHAHPLFRLASSPLAQASVDTLVEFALSIWYAESFSAREVLEALQGDIMAQRRAVYLIDKFRRYPCVTKKRAAQLKSFVYDWSALKMGVHPEPLIQLVITHKLDKLAADWGLNEDVTLQAKNVLIYQTRHYTASLGIVTGYSEPE